MLWLVHISTNSFLIAFLFLFCCSYAHPAPAQQDFNRLIQEAKSEDKKVFIVFGATWCPDCNALDRMLSSPEIKAIFKPHYKLLKVDIGEYDRNMDFAERFGNPQEKGIPAIVIVNPDETVLVSTNNGEFAKARRMKSQQLAEFLRAYR